MQLLFTSQALFSFKHYTLGMLCKFPCIRLFGVALLLAVLSGCATTPPSRTDNVCSIFKQKRSWHRVAVNAEKKWGTSMHIPLAIMNQESSFNSKARPPREKLFGFIPWRRPSSAYGYAQAIDGTWRQYLNSTGEYGRDRDNFADATDFVHWYLREAITQNGVAPNDAYNLYLNYHEGTGGFAKRTYQKKKWLPPVAAKVQRRVDMYRSQYAGCKDDFKPGFWGRLFGR